MFVFSNNNLRTTRSSITGSRGSLYEGKARPKSRQNNNFQSRQSNNFNNDERGRKPFRQEGRNDYEETFRESVPDREYNNIQQNRTPRQSGTFNGNNSFKDRQQRSQTPVRNWKQQGRSDENEMPIGILKTKPEQSFSEPRRESYSTEHKFESVRAEPKIERPPRRESALPEPKFETIAAPKVESQRVTVAVPKPVFELDIKRQ